MSLSGIAFDSVHSALAAAYAQNRVSSPRPASVAKVAAIIPIRAAGTGTALATSLGTLISTLASGDVASSRTALTSLARYLNAQPQADASALTALLPRLGLALENGNPTHALTQINTFLLHSQTAAGTGFSAKV